jgi:glycerol transport system ATP-binding protein
MTRGRAVQIGSASELFDRPQHTFVGHFIGSPGMNFLPAEAGDDGLASPAAASPRRRRRCAASGPVTLGVRPST